MVMSRFPWTEWVEWGGGGGWGAENLIERDFPLKEAMLYFFRQTCTVLPVIRITSGSVHARLPKRRAVRGKGGKKGKQ